MKKISVVTVDFNSHEETHGCLQSLKLIQKNGLEVEIIVVDNASSTPLTVAKSENAVLLRSDINMGFTGGYNLGIQYALEHGADYILLLNNDTLVDKNLLIEMLKT